MKIHYILTCSLALAFATPALTAEEKQPQNETLKKVFETAPTGKALAIHVARGSVKSGDSITLKGRVMGNIKPFVDGRSIFILGDTEILQACSDNPGDACETPWDNCCDTPEDIKKGTATIQVIDANGKVLKEGIESVKGLEKLSYVTVTGKVAPASSEQLLLVNAEAIKVDGMKKP